MNSILAFVIVMLVWTISDFVAKRTKSLLSSLFVASIIFLIGFLTGIFPEDLLSSSSLLALAGVVFCFHHRPPGDRDQPRPVEEGQWKTFVIGVATVVGIGVLLLVAGLVFGSRITGSASDGYAQALDFVVAGAGALSGGTIQVLIIQEAALGIGLTSIAVYPFSSPPSKGSSGSR